jgi:uncharacterized protein YxjI
VVAPDRIYPATGAGVSFAPTLFAVEAAMSVRVICQCGTSYELKDEFAGKLVKCPQCGRENRVPGIAPVTGTAGVFDRDVFLLRQQLLKISEKYDVCDEQGNKIIYIERPAHLLQNLGAILAGVVAGGGLLLAFVTLADMNRGNALEVVFAILAMVGMVAGFFGVAIALSAKRHVTFYRDQTKRERLMEVLQDKKFQPLTTTYTVNDAAGRCLALLWKSNLSNIIRKRWVVKSPEGAVRYIAKEDSMILSLLRRLIGPLFGVLRTNFIILPADSEDIVGEFNRKFTILDRYALDLKADAGRRFDRRVALALGVMLDTGERR